MKKWHWVLWVIVAVVCCGGCLKQDEQAAEVSPATTVQPVTADEPGLSALTEGTYTGKLHVRPWSSGQRFYGRTSTGKHVFTTGVRVFDLEGTPVRGLDREHFDFSVDGKIDRSMLGGGEGYGIVPAYHDSVLTIDVLIDASPGVLLFLNSTGDAATEGDLVKWVRSFVPAIRQNRRVNIHLADRDGFRTVASVKKAAGDETVQGIVDRLVAISHTSSEGSYDLGLAARQIADGYQLRVRSSDEPVSPRLLLIASFEKRLAESPELERHCRELEETGLIVRTLQVGGGKVAGGEHMLPFDPDSPAQIAEQAVLLSTIAAPFYTFQAVVGSGRIVADGITRHLFVHAA